MIKGRRVYPHEDGSFDPLEPGDYIHVGDDWFSRVPDPKFHMGNLRKHTIQEHEDGTITVSPSILHTEPNVGQWHGFLERGIWREC